MISFVEKDVLEHNVGQMENVCAKCGVLMFHNETHKTLPNNTLCKVILCVAQMVKSKYHLFWNLQKSSKIYCQAHLQSLGTSDSTFTCTTQFLLLHQCH